MEPVREAVVACSEPGCDREALPDGLRCALHANRLGTKPRPPGFTPQPMRAVEVVGEPPREKRARWLVLGLVAAILGGGYAAYEMMAVNVVPPPVAGSVETAQTRPPDPPQKILEDSFPGKDEPDLKRFKENVGRGWDARGNHERGRPLLPGNSD